MSDEMRARTAHVFYLRFREEEVTPKASETTLKGRKLLSHVLRTRYGIEDDPLEIKTHERGKPYLPKHPEIEYNISHSGRYIVLAVASVPVGIDVQEIRITSIDKLGRHVFSDSEYRDFLMSEDRQEAFFRMWVRKEAYIKWTGDGLYRELRELPLDGWFQYITIDRGYYCAIHAGIPLSVEVEEVTLP